MDETSVELEHRLRTEGEERLAANFGSDGLKGQKIQVVALGMLKAA